MVFPDEGHWAGCPHEAIPLNGRLPQPWQRCFVWKNEGRYIYIYVVFWGYRWWGVVKKYLK